MSDGGKALAALALVIGLGLIFSLPVLTSDDGLFVRGSRVGSPTSSPSPTQVETSPIEQATKSRFAESYPRRCLERVSEPTAPGLIAALHEGKATIAGPSGDNVDTFDAEPPIAFSPSGRYLASGGDSVYDLVKGGHGPLLGLGLESWKWSPRSDCVAGITAAGALIAGPPGRAGATLIERRVESFSFSPDGRSLAVVVTRPGGRNIIVVELRSGLYGHIAALDAPVIELATWSPDSIHVYYWSAPGQSVFADGGRLRFLPDRTKVAGTFVPDPTQFAFCDDQLVGVAGAGRDMTGDKTLVSITDAKLKELTPDGSGVYTSPTCAPGSSTIAAIRQPTSGSLEGRTLVLVGTSSSRDLTLTGNYWDDAPMWSNEGIVFVRTPIKGGPTEVWHIPSGSTARATGLLVDGPQPGYGRVPVDWFGGLLDWTLAPGG